MATRAKTSTSQSVLKSRYTPESQFVVGTIATWFSMVVPLTLISSALLLWWLSLPEINPEQFTFYGIVSTLPLSFYLAFILINISFAFVISREDTHSFVFGIHILVLVLIIHATLPLVYEVPRYAWTYKHLGVVDYVQRFGTLDPTIDAYQNWPGFFTFMALISDFTGIQNLMALSKWAQVFWNLLYIGALRMLYKAFTNDMRLVWLGIWVFYLTSWVAQDYFAPQALAFFMHLVVIGALLTWFQVRQRPVEQNGERQTIFNFYRTVVNRRAMVEAPRARIQPVQRGGLAAVIVLSFFVIAFSHQLTPFMTLITILFLILFRRCNRNDLFILMSLLLLAWLAYMSITFIANAELAIFGSFGKLFNNLETNLRDYSSSSNGQTFVSQVTRLTSLSVWVLAFFGVVRRVRNGHWDLAAVLVAIAPFAILTMQGYSGEGLFRVYLLSLPGMAFLIGTLFYSGVGGNRGLNTALVVLVASIILSATVLFTYFGNERINHMTTVEVDTLDEIYTTAPTGSLILTGSSNSPTRFKNYANYWHFSLNNLEAFWQGEPWEYRETDFDEYDLQLLHDAMADEKYTNAYLIISTTQKQFLNAYNMEQANYLDRLETALQQSPLFVTRNVDESVTIYMIAEDVDGSGS